MKRRLAFAVAVAVVAIGYAWLHARVLAPEIPYRDFDQVWFAARAVLRGHDPYAVIRQGATYDGRRFEWGLYYPLTATTVVLPLAWLPMAADRGVYLGQTVDAIYVLAFYVPALVMVLRRPNASGAHGSILPREVGEIRDCVPAARVL